MTKRVGKERLTITMRKDILEALDGFIDGDSIRNRSHAIEYIVGRYLGAGISTCVILAAGKTDQTTKPLLRIANRPVIAYMLDMLRQANITNIIMVISEGREDLKKYLGDGSQYRVKITYVEDTMNCGSAYSLSLAKEYIKDTFLLMYGDILSEIDLQKLSRWHREQDHVLATLAVTACTNPSLFGVTELQGNRVYRILEKPSEYNKSNLVFSGISVCEPELFDYLTNAQNKYIARDILPDLAHRGQIAGYPFSDKWFDVSHKAEYERASTGWVTPRTE